MSGRLLRRGNWSVQELERLRALLPRRGVETTAILLRRSADSVYRKAMEIMRAAPRRGPWTGAEDRILRDAWGVVDRRLLGAILGRPPADVAGRAAQLRRTLRTGGWTQAERHRLKEHYGTRRDEDLEVSLQRPADEIAAMARDLCLAKDKRFAAVMRSHEQRGDGAPRPAMPRWTEAQVEELRRLYPGCDNLEIARRLGRTVASVANKANQLGLHKGASVLSRIGRSNVNWRYRRRSGAAGLEADGTSR